MDCDPARVVVLHSAYSDGDQSGENQHVLREVEALRSSGLQVELVWLDATSLPSARLALRALWSAEARKAVRQSVGLGRRTVVHAHNLQPMLSASVRGAARSAGARYVETVHNYRMSCIAASHFRDGAACTLCLVGTSVHGVLHRCYRGSAGASVFATAAQRTNRATRGQVQTFLAVSRSVADYLLSLGLPPDAVRMHENFVPDPGLVTNLGDTERKAALFVGRMVEEKGVRLLLDAWRADRRLPPLWLVGNGPLAAEAADAAMRDARITYHGRLSPDAVTALRARAAFAVVPSVWEEPFGLTVVEALAQGLPSVVTDRGALSSLVSPDAGIVVEADPLSLGGGVLAMTQICSSLRIAARRAYEERFSERAAVTRLRGIYRELLSR